MQASALGNWARQSALAYPVANLVHLLGLVLLVGGIGLLDLRLAGLLRRLPVADLSAVLTPLALAGLALMALSGPILFAADAVSLAASEIFRLKLLLIAAALANALLFRWRYRGRLANWDAAPPAGGRALALLSIGLWLWIAGLGRWIAYA